MKKLNNKGFTLIELLAVITIMGILMLVAIPAVQRTIENSRKNTFANTAKLYIDAVRTAVVADELSCTNGSNTFTIAGAEAGADAANAKKYYVAIDGAGDWMQSGGTSPWGSGTAAKITGYVLIEKYQGNGDTIKYNYSAALVDGGKHGFSTMTKEENIGRAAVQTADQNNPTTPSGTKCDLVV